MSDTTFYNFNLFDGKENKIFNKAWFKINDQTGKIVKRGENVPPNSNKKIDLKNKYVMPGFFNVHTHICMDPHTGSGNTDANFVETTVRAIDHLHKLLKDGVTYIRECGSTYNIDIYLEKLREQGKIKGIPIILPSGHPYSMTGGHGDMPNFGTMVDSPDEMRKAVRTGLRDGVQAIKLMATGGVMTPQDFMNDPQLTVPEMRVAVKEGHHKGKIIAAHAEGNPGIQNAIDSGVDSVEHGCYTTPEEADQMVKQGTYLTPTLFVIWAIAKYGKGILPDWELRKDLNAMDDVFKNITEANKRGVKLTIGTDAGCPFTWFDESSKEFELFTKLGMSAFQAYQCSSINSATLCRVEKNHGTLETGKFADFQVLDDNPLSDVKIVQQKGKQVYLKGKKEF